MRARRLLCGICGTLGLVASVLAQAQGDFYWKPSEGHPNYAQGPFAVEWQGDMFLGAHSGYFGEPWYRLRDERPWVVEFTPRLVRAQDRVIDLLPTGHEFGFGAAVRVNGWWLYAGIYTLWETLGQPDRVHPMLAMTEDLMKAPYPYTWWDLPIPSGAVMSSLVWVGPRLLYFYGNEVYQLAIYETGPYKAPALMKLLDMPPMAWSDIAMGTDGRLYALVTARDGCWWFDCKAIDEYASSDLGRSWELSGRSWESELFVGDACYVKDELGHINRENLFVWAVVNPSGTTDPRNGEWYLHWWSDSTDHLPSLDHEPGWSVRVPRKHLTRKP